MKGFPNAISNLPKLGRALMVVKKADPSVVADDDGFGADLILAQVISARKNAGLTPPQYLAQQRAKPADRRSHETNARYLRQLFRMSGCLTTTLDRPTLTPLGLALAECRSRAPNPLETPLGLQERLL